MKGHDEFPNASDKSIFVSEDTAESAESGLDLLDKMASTDDTPTSKANYFQRTAMKYLLQEDTKKALKYCDLAIAIQPEEANFYILKSYILHNAGCYEEALKESDKAIRLDPANAMYHNFRSMIFYRHGNYKEALKESDEAIRLDPDNMISQQSRSLALLKLNSYGES